MSDIYALDLAMVLPHSASTELLEDLRWHLGVTSQEEEAPFIAEYPLFDARGPATRIGGTLMGELTRGAAGWSLTVRQEVHEEMLPDLESLLDRLARICTQEGTTGYLRFHENYVPDLLVNKSGTCVRVELNLADRNAL